MLCHWSNAVDFTWALRAWRVLGQGKTREISAEHCFYLFSFSSNFDSLFHMEGIGWATSVKWSSDSSWSQWWKNSIWEQVWGLIAKASQNLEKCPIHWLWMVNALSRQSLLLLRVEEMSQTIRGADMECVSKSPCKIHACRIMIVFLPYQQQKCSSVSWNWWRECRIST